MLLKSREIAFLGIMMAFAVLLITLGGYIESSTIFFLAAASFLTGVVERNFSVLISVLFLAGTALLGFFLAPQKLYVVTFTIFAIYIITAEYFEKKVFMGQPEKKFLEWVVKCALYHIMFILVLALFLRFFGIEAVGENKAVSFLMQYKALFVVAGILMMEIFWLVFDRAYIFFMRRYSRYFMVDRYE